MKQNIYTMNKPNLKSAVAALALSLCGLGTQAQTTILADFESFNLPANSAYSPTVSTPFQTPYAAFEYQYDNAFSYWSGGFSYTNKYDSATAGSGNLYGVRAYNGYTNSATYVVGQDQGVIRTAVPQTTVAGFYMTNTTFAYKSMAKGDAFSKKFGGTSGSDPDFFKVVVKGYKSGALKNDSVTFMLADFTFTNNTQDYIVTTWQFVNTASIGEVDSIKFFMRSSDVGQFGINTPLFFAIDNFMTNSPVIAGLMSHSTENLNVELFPNPFKSSLSVKLPASAKPVLTTVLDAAGKIVYTKELSAQDSDLDLGNLQSGVYFAEFVSGNQRTVKKIVKN